MKVITVASDLNNMAFNNFLAPSCEYYALDAIVLEYDDVFGSNRLKDVLLNVYLEDVSDNEVIFFTDATDTVFVTNQKEILQKFDLFHAPLVFSAEINCWPDRTLEIGYPACNAHFNYLNSGGFIGQAGYLKEIYKKYPIFETANDPRFLWSNQYYWNTLYQMEYNKIKIDHHCQIFYNTAIPLEDFALHKEQLKDEKMFNDIVRAEQDRLDKEIQFKNGRIESKITNSLPCHIHFPGIISKQLMNRGYFDSLKPPRPV
jgi:hypothetical protein